MKSIVLYDEKYGDDEHHVLKAVLTDSGDLVLEGYDCGRSVKEFWGDFDYEYWLTVKAENIPAVLLWLIKERFKTDSEFREWLKEKEIPHDFKSWV